MATQPHCSLCHGPQGQHDSVYAPPYAPGLHSRSDHRFVGFHLYTEDCLLEWREVLAHPLSLFQKIDQRQRDAIRRSRVCHCARCQFLRERAVIEQRVNDGDEKAVELFLSTEQND